MFNGGVPEQLRRFIVTPPPPPPPETAARGSTLPFPLSFSTFETTNHFLNSVLGSSNTNNHKIISHHHHHHREDIKDVGTSSWMGPTDDHDDDDDGGDGHHHHRHHPWSSDEVLALLRLRSTAENWFPGFTWDNISRKLTEVGFIKRTPQECKDKFEEEERRYFHNNNNTNNDHHHHINEYNNKDNFRMFSELEEFYHHHHGHDDHHHNHDDDEHGQNKRQKSYSLEEPRSQEKDETGHHLDEEEEKEGVGIDARDEGKSGKRKNKKKKKKKKRRYGFEMLKGFCEGLVRNMIAQQEEMHKKILEDMVKRDNEKIAREEAWKKQETDNFNKEIEIRAREQALASDRNSTIINFINNFTSLNHHGNSKAQSPSTSHSSSSLVFLPPQTVQSDTIVETLSSSQALNDKSPEPISHQTLPTKTHIPKPPKSEKSCDLGKRWPRDEVLALVNIRCDIINTHHHHHHEQPSSSSTSKGPPLWERISKKMMELGYKRSAKRCKEKWENINKYFRKTKDVNKKRPLDSRTCPYFHQLTALYGRLDPGSTRPDDHRVVGPGDDDLGVHADVAPNGDDDDEKTTTVVHASSGFDIEF